VSVRLQSRLLPLRVPMSPTTTTINPMRSRGTRRSCTASIVLGHYSNHRFPGGERFQFYCRRLRAAFPRCRRERRSACARALARLCGTIETRSWIFDQYPHAHGKLVPMLIRLATQENEWLRPLDSWQPDLLDSGKEQYSHLHEHLFIKYPPPDFFKSFISSRDGYASLEYSWYQHLGSGKSLRTAPCLSVSLSKREAHLVLQAPTDLDIHGALLWGKLAALGAGSELIAEIMRTSWGYGFVCDSGRRWHDELVEMDEWLVALVRLFVRTPSAASSTIGPLIDFLSAEPRRFEVRIRPDLKNQTLGSLTRAMEDWHDNLHLQFELQAKLYEFWPPDRGIRPFYLPARRDEDFCFWQLVELNTQRSLTEEGLALRHCVASYSARCASGSSSIWSLRTVSPQGRKSIATIEVQKHNGKRIISQTRAYSNADPPETAMEIIHRWARRSSIESR
jgi:hypothetical protein